MRHRVALRALQGICLAAGAPLGWLTMRLAAGGSPMQEVAESPGLYTYMLLATAAAFGSFGALLGRYEARLLDANRRLDELSMTDPLTGLRNLRYFRARLVEELADAGRRNRPACLLLLDLDGFKQVNDRLGHPAGDRLLKSIGETMRRLLRHGETAARVGGEEFALILPDTDLPGGRVAAERLRAAVAACRLEGDHGVTASIGLALAERSADEWYAGADRALYEAKRRGRNRVVAAGD
jgi:diguanylate cyclase (GGDEF)-like protein